MGVGGEGCEGSLSLMTSSYGIISDVGGEDPGMRDGRDPLSGSFNSF